MTVISLVQLFPTANVRPWIDDLLAVDSLVFLLSAALSYWSIRGGEGGERYERRADVLFMLGLSVMVVVSFVMAFQLFGV